MIARFADRSGRGRTLALAGAIAIAALALTVPSAPALRAEESEKAEKAEKAAPEPIRVERVPVPAWRTALLSKLEETKVTFAFEDTPLRDVLPFVRNVSGISVAVDESARTALDSRVTLKVTDLEWSSVLDLLVAYADDVAWGVREGEVVVAARNELDPSLDPTIGERIYHVGTRLGEEASADALRSLVETFVHPESWESDRTAMRFEDGRLVVRHEEEAHAALEAFLNALATHGALRPPWSAKRRKLEGALDRKITIALEDTALGSAVDLVSTLAGVNVVVAPAVQAKRRAITLDLDDVPTRSVLHEAARAAGAWVKVEDDVVTITAEFPSEVRVHDVRGLEGAEGLTKWITAFADGSAKHVPPPELWGDRLIVRQSAENHEKIAARLEALRKRE